MSCKKCGYNLPNNAKFCEKCGAPQIPYDGSRIVSKNEASKKPESETSKRKKYFLIGAGIIILVMIITVVFYYVILGAGFFDRLNTNIPPSPSSTNSIFTERTVTVYFFYGEECPHCHNVMPFIQNISKKYPNVDFLILETWHNETNQALSTSLHQKLGMQSAGVPEVIVGNVSLVGDRDIPVRLESVILDELKRTDN